MELDFSFIKKQEEYNEILRIKYERLVQKEKELVGGAGRRITQKKIAKLVGISDSMISKWLEGTRELKLETLMSMADVLLTEEGLLQMKCGEKAKI